MADVAFSSTIASADNFILGGTSERSKAGSIAVHLLSASFSGSITVKGRVKGSGAAFVAIPYVSLHLNGAVGTGAYVSTAITGTSVILVPASGMDISLDCTSFTSGAMTVTIQPVLGAAA